MKRQLLTLFAAIGLLNSVDAQVSAYTFTQSTGTYTPITGGIVLGDSLSDDVRFVDPATPLGGTATAGVGFPIGFNFTYNGIVFNKIAINANGWISLGKDSVNVQSSSSYNPISAASTATPTLLRNRIAGFALDLKSQGAGELRVETVGTSPNKVCVIQWKNYRKYMATGDNYNFQICLNETSNTINFVYGTLVNGATASTAQVGLGGTVSADFINRATFTDWAATTAGTTNDAECAISSTVFPASGTTFTWTPGAPCSGTPTAGVANAPLSACAGVNLELSLTGVSSGSGLTFQWQSSATGATGSFTNIVGGTTSTFTTMQTAITYYQCIVTCSASSQSATSNVVTVAMGGTNDCYCIPSSTNCGSSDVITNVTFGTINNSTTCSTNGYSYYATPNPVLSRGQTYAGSVTVGAGGTEYVGVWIDYDHSGTFDSLEFTAFGHGNGVVIDSSITIPSTATVGTTKMRIRLRYYSALTGADACIGYTYGETEDYLVTIAGSAGINEMESEEVSIYPNPTTGVLNVNFKTESNTLNVKLMNVEGQVIYNDNVEHFSGNYSSMINISQHAKGIYFLQITADNKVTTKKVVLY